MDNNNEKKLNGTVIVTYRCNAHCSMDEMVEDYGIDIPLWEKSWINKAVYAVHGRRLLLRKA